MSMSSSAPVAKVEMMIRKPVAEVFRAFTQPELTTKFWFTRSSGSLALGQTVHWEWEMYGAAADVKVLELEENRKIVVDFGSRVEWRFTPRSADETIVTITNSGFAGEDPVSEALDATEGFTIVLCGLKAYLEHGLVLGLVGDKAPDAHVARG
ncbi:SRPBCC family protein [Paenibacillus whitsoniae]|uniref:Polyketide cyclase n=1 Tax=Paenibacillus whitsoniae TaxID=2496558 RepID=A0A430JA12_9BACL|nr:SRPBCC family protein [Paenibacillus whitsoniae]RTE07878.1 polyketide cyclase [Paenibacillus whitsoniae]